MPAINRILRCFQGVLNYYSQKLKLSNYIASHTEFEDVRRTFCQNSTHEEVFESGVQYTEAKYKLKPNDKSMSLSQLRYKTFAAIVRKRVDLASLPPTKDAARLHLYRAYYQVQVWLGHELEPTEWGCKNSSIELEPVTMTRPPAPESLLLLISCNCSQGCENACSCQKVGKTQI